MPDTPATPRETIPRIVWGVAALAILIRAGVALGTHFVNEDFLITLRYAENIASGIGFVYNPGERVLGTTTPLYTLYLALVAKLGLSATVAAKSAAILADGALCVVVYRWVCAIGQARAGLAAALCVALNPVQIRWAVAGMETSLVALGGAVVWLALTERRYPAAYGTLGVLFLLRWDTLLLTAVGTATLICRERRVPVRELLLFGVIVAPWLVFATSYFGSPIPVTAAAKLTVYGWRGHDTLFPGSPPLLHRLLGNPAAVLATLCAAAGVVYAGRRRLVLLIPPLIWLALYAGALSGTRVPLFEWYLIPPMPVYDLLVALGAVWGGSRVVEQWPHAVKRASAWGAALVAAAGTAVASHSSCRDTQRIEDHLRRPMGLWLRAQSQPGERIMLEPIGYIGYYSRRPVLDTVGLVTPAVLPFWRSDSAAPLLEIALAFRPDWCVLRPREVEHIRGGAPDAVARWEREYALVRTFSYQRERDREPFVFHVFRRRDLATGLRSAPSTPRPLPARVAAAQAACYNTDIGFARPAGP